MCMHKRVSLYVQLIIFFSSLGFILYGIVSVKRDLMDVFSRFQFLLYSRTLKCSLLLLMQN